MKKAMITFIILILVSTFVILFAFYWSVMSGVALYDGNFEAFYRILNENQRTSILAQAKGHVLFVVYLLLFTNILWATGTVFMLKKIKDKK